MNLITLFLTCANEQEAKKISKKLLEAKLAACIRRTGVSSDFIWKGKVGHSDEVLLIIESVQEKFDEIEKLVKKLHSYELFVLTVYPVAKASVNVEEWVKESIGMTKKTDLKDAKLFTDGGSRGNPGPSAGAFLICKTDDNVVEKSGFYIGITTNNQAEYQALLKGLERSQAVGIRKLNVFMDSELVVKQLNGRYKIKNKNLEPLYRQIKDLATDFDEISFTHVPRALNKEADMEVNRILNEQKTAN